jgi:hypothetical protein
MMRMMICLVVLKEYSVLSSDEFGELAEPMVMLFLDVSGAKHSLCLMSDF